MLEARLVYGGIDLVNIMTRTLDPDVQHRHCVHEEEGKVAGKKISTWQVKAVYKAVDLGIYYTPTRPTGEHIA